MENNINEIVFNVMFKYLHPLLSKYKRKVSDNDLSPEELAMIAVGIQGKVLCGREARAMIENKIRTKITCEGFRPKC